MSITLGDIKAHGALADRKAYSVLVTYTDDDTQETTYSTVVTFTGPVNGIGPVVTQTSAMENGIFVRDPGQFGETFGPDWIRAFYAE